MELSVATVLVPETLTVASLDALGDALEGAAAADGVWVLRGAAAGTFCRGMDLASLVRDGVDASVSLRRFAACLSRLRRAPRPTIALVDGDAMGGGVGLAAACDVVIATPAASFALPEALFGLLPGAVMPVLLERMPPQKARLLVLRGRSQGATWARESGLVDEIVAPADLEAAAARAVRDLARVAPRRVTGLRSWVFELVHLEADAALARGAGITAELVRDGSVRDRVSAFLEDGTPPWVRA